MKDVELRLIAELMKNSRRSDRDLGKTVHVSQATIARLRTKLEKSGVIREYTIIPDFSKIGYHLWSFTFAKFRDHTHLEEMKRKIGSTGRRLSDISQAVMVETGTGMGASGVVMALHKDYTAYLEFKNWLRQFSFISPYELETFMMDLDAKAHYRYLTFSTLARHMLAQDRPTKEKASSHE